MTILIVDDAQTVRSYHRDILEQSGFEAAEAANGLEALEYMRRRGESVAALLVDINMPQMDGYTLVRELRQDPELAGYPAIMISTESELHDQDLAFQAGANGYLIKPVQPDQLLRQLSLIAGHALAAEESA
ncbi:response regulator [Natronospirillum operosum]|uniref:Response regulator n=1 Tax=Natronospirillum operosum TaxID=2759953 RepID=A0A4Z0WDR1_9GAMM|nr:response regulator [Natronospirillum operosum]TGG93296.1 response regulator [Natronospirillum operosum]